MARAGAGRPLHEIDPASMAPFLALPRVAGAAGDRAGAADHGRAAPTRRPSCWRSSTGCAPRTNTRRPAAHTRRSPIRSRDFLFDQKAGHCEYFASATALLLRAAGVPSRYVNGFLGGEWNEIGHYVDVRENRAHSWVEAYLGELGWMRVDATPPVAARAAHGRPAPAARLGRLLLGTLGGRLRPRPAAGAGAAPGTRLGNPAKANASAAETFTWRSLSLPLVALLVVALGSADRPAPQARRATQRVHVVSVPARRWRGFTRRCLERLAQRGHPRTGRRRRVNTPAASMPPGWKAPRPFTS